MNAATNEAVLDEVIAMFEGFERAIWVPGDANSNELLTARIDLSHAHGRGSLGICTTRRAVAALAPFPGVDPIDWIGEIANLAAGRLKYALLARVRVRIQQSVPVVTVGDATPDTPGFCMLLLRDVRDALRLWIDLDVPLAEKVTGEELALAPGSLLMFD